jgi:hypothetical protein
MVKPVLQRNVTDAGETPALKCPSGLCWQTVNPVRQFKLATFGNIGEETKSNSVTHDSYGTQ